MSMKEEYTAIDMATAAADGFRAGQRAAQSAGVPECFKQLLRHAHGMTMGVDWNKGTQAGYHREPLGEAVVQCQAWLAAAPAAPTVKAEQVQCDTCHGQGEICVGQQTFGYMSMQPPEPIMEVCPECGGEEAPSLPAAGSAYLTAVRCQCCAAEYPHDSYDAGFIAGSGMCQVCDAAIPAVDLPSAAPAEQPYPHGIAEDLERSDWAPLEALQWYAAGKHFDVADGRTRIIDTGAVASNALKHASLAYLELKGGAELSELRAALSAHVSVPECVRNWFDAKLAHVEAVDAYNTRLAFIRKHMPFGASPDPEYQIMEAADRKVRELNQAMFFELRALLNGGEA